jgi:hypothetical protein
MRNLFINLPDIYDLSYNSYDENNYDDDYNNDIYYYKITIELINSKININKYTNKNDEEHVVLSLSDGKLYFKDIFTKYNNYSYVNLFFSITNDDSNCKMHYLSKKIDPFRSPYIDIHDNLLLDSISFYRLVYFSEYLIFGDITKNNTIIIYSNIHHMCISPYYFGDDYACEINLNQFCKYISIYLNKLCNYNSINNDMLDIKINNIDVKFKYVLKNLKSDNTMVLHLIFISIDNLNTSYLESKNCKKCKKYNNFLDLMPFAKLIKYNKNNYNKNLNQIIPNIFDCDKHHDLNSDIFRKIINFKINISDILSKLNIITTQKIFVINYNYI